MAGTKKIFLCLLTSMFCCFITDCSKAQPRNEQLIGQLTQQLKEKPPLPVRVKLLYQLGNLHEFAHKKALDYYQKGLRLAKETNNKLAIAQGHAYLGELNLYYRSFNKALYEFREGEGVATKCGFVKEQIDCLNGISRVFIEKNKYDKALKQQQYQSMVFQRKLRNVALASLLLLIVVLVLLYNRYQLRHKILHQKSKVLEQENARHKAEGRCIEAEQKLKQEEYRLQKMDMEYKNRELATSTLLIHRKNEVLTNIQGELNTFQSQVPKKLNKNILSIKKIIKENRNLEEDWKQLKLHFNEVHPGFFDILQQRFTSLSQNDLRLCAYIRINLANKEIARILNVEFRSVQVAKYRLKKKMNLTKEEDLGEFIRQIELEK